MKKLVLVIMVCVLLLGSVSAVSESTMGVVLLNEPTVETEAVSLEDFKLKSDVEIAGYGIFSGLSFDFLDEISYYYGTSSLDVRSLESGADAEFALLNMDIVNTTTKEKSFLDDCTVKAVYDDTYEYAGWCYQYDYNRPRPNYLLGKEELNFTIQPMYQGHFAFGATLPNAVVTGTKPLRLEITIDGNEITYYIRK